MKTLDLRKIPKRELPLWNRIFGRNGDISLELGSDTLRVLFYASGVEWRPEQFAKISCDHQTFWIGLTIREAFLEEEMARSFEGLRVKGLPAQLKAAIGEVLIEKAMERFEAWRGVSVKIEELLPALPGPEPGKTLPFRLMSGEGYPEVQGCFYFGEESFLWFSQLIAGVPAGISRHCLDIPVRCGLEVGRARVKAGEMRGLGRLDLIRLDEYYLSEGRKLLLHVHPRIEIWAEIGGGKAILKNRKEREVSDEGVGEARDFELVEVELRFEVGAKQIMVKDLSELKPGFTFDLDVSVDRAVTVTANGKKIGRGQLVDIDGRIGVQILEVFGNAAEQHA